MYSVRLDEQKYFTGSYVRVGTIPGGVPVRTLPEDMSKATCYKYGPFEVKSTIDVMVCDPETGEPILDENDNIQYEKKEVVIDYVDWQLDEEKANALKLQSEEDRIRDEREHAFQLIDKYQLVLLYNSLTEEQKEELAAYRQGWLDAPETRTSPTAPLWMI